MQASPKSADRKVPVLVHFDPSLLDEADRLAERDFESNRSLLVRTAVREFLRRDRDQDASDVPTERAA